MGLYPGWRNTTYLNSFYTDANYTGMKYAHEFQDHLYDWGGIKGFWSGWNTWVGENPAGRRMTFSVPMLPGSTDGGTTVHSAKYDMPGLAAGNYDTHFSDIGTNLQSYSYLQNAILRLGWEANGNTFPWRIDLDGGSGSATTTEVDNYKAAFQGCVTRIRENAPGVKIEWEMNCTLDDAGRTLEELYPGDAYVDFIGLAIYDYNIGGLSSSTPENRWNYLMEPNPSGGANNGLRYHRDFANSRGKPKTITEWGLWQVAQSPGGGGDNPYFINKVADWVIQNRFAYQIYNEGNSSHKMSTLFPNSLATFRQRFGG